MVFRAQMTPFLRLDDFLDVAEFDDPIEVGLGGVNHENLRRQSGAAKVAKAERVRLYIMQLFQHIPTKNQMMVAGSPGETWNIFKRL